MGEINKAYVFFKINNMIIISVIIVILILFGILKLANWLDDIGIGDLVLNFIIIFVLFLAILAQILYSIHK